MSEHQRQHHRRPHVVVAGGGIAGVEALLALRELAGHRVSLELVTPEPDLVLRPYAVAAPFGTEEVRRVPLAGICADVDAHLRADEVTFVDVARRRVETAAASLVPFDALVVAVGARRRPAVPGALTFDGRAGIDGLRELLAAAREGDVRSLTFAVPDGLAWPLPAYELALQTAAALEDGGVEVRLVTPEPEPLAAFGGAAGARVRALLEARGVTVRTGTVPQRVAGGFLLTSTGALPVDAVVALPAVEGPRIGGLPADAQGFVPVDEHCAVAGAPGVHAVGDGSDAPVKQGGLATQQADAAAEAIASSFGAPCAAEPFRPVLRAQLLTGDAPWFLRGPRAGRAPLWWPAGKVAARYLAPYLADRLGSRLGAAAPLEDREPAPEGPGDRREREAVQDLALLMADDEAASGHPGEALRWLEAATAGTSTLPPEYVARRRRWRARRDGTPSRVREPGGPWA